MTVTPKSEDARDYYQQRLALMFQVGFALSATLLVAFFLARGLLGPGFAAEVRSASRGLHLAATLLMGALWAALRRGRLRYGALEALDAGGVLGLSALLCLGAGLQEVRALTLLNLVAAVGLVLELRAVIVPGTAWRTAALGAATSALALAVFLLSAHRAWPVHQPQVPGWPLALQGVSLVLWLVALVAAATLATHLLYDMRREMRAVRRLGQYMLGDKLGEGGMGTVYRATHGLLRRETALKLLPLDRVDPGTLQRFEREVVETARLRHPNTVAIFDYGRTPEGVFYYAMEYLDGLTLARLVEREGPLPPGRVVHLLAQVCASLDEAHTMGLVHRDIKPANIMVIGHTAAWDLVKVLDFGLVKSLAPLGEGEPALTRGDQLTGTPLYMAPEVIARPDAFEPRSDLYALAAVGYFMLAGRHVFAGRSLIEICAEHLHTPPVPVHERLGAPVPADLEALLLRGLSKAPADRPPSAAAFREALLRCQVPPWTQEDARAWWRTHGARAVSPGAQVDDLPSTPTVTWAPAQQPPAAWRASDRSLRAAHPRD